MSKQHDWEVIVIGGGPAGMMAAGRAAERGKRVLLLEKNSSLGKKLLITGGGRCNVTNNKPEVRTMLSQYKGSGKFLFSAFTQFGVAETLEFFHSRGMQTKEENDGRLFPVSDSAQSVLDVLTEYMREGGVTIQTDASVAAIEYDQSAGQIRIVLQDKSVFTTASCVVAAGGVSRPETGSTGEGFGWLKKMGLSTHQPDMSLVPITLSNQWVKKVAGVTLQDVKLTTFKNGAKQKNYTGKVLFTHVGVSGPTILNMSRDVGELLSGTEADAYTSVHSPSVCIRVDMFPKTDDGSLRKELHDILTTQSNKLVKNALTAFVPASLVPVILSLAQVDPDTPCHSVRSDDRKKIVSLTKSLQLDVSGLQGHDKAIISSGGVALEDIHFKTMQSKRVPGVFVVGDMLNIDRPSGGYSLQLCWTTGYIAGDNC